MVATQLLEGDAGWEVRESYSHCMEEFDRFEQHIIQRWHERLMPELTSRLKQPVFVSTSYSSVPILNGLWCSIGQISLIVIYYNA